MSERQKLLDYMTKKQDQMEEIAESDLWQYADFSDHMANWNIGRKKLTHKMIDERILEWAKKKGIKVRLGDYE